MKPWDYHPALTKGRLTLIGQIIADARNAVFEQFDERGDDAWAIGCRAFSWVRKAIMREAISGENSWLSVMDPSKQFIFRIGEIPVRFLRGDPDVPHSRTLSTISRESVQIAMVFPGESRALQLIWRFIAETDFTGDLEAVWFVGMTSEGIPECKWLVPILDAELSELDDLRTRNRADAEDEETEQELPEPSVTLPVTEADDTAEN